MMSIISIAVLIFVGLAEAAGLLAIFQRIKAVREKNNSLSADYARLQDKYKDVTDLEEVKTSLSATSATIETQIAQQRALKASLAEELDLLKRQIALYNDEQTVIDCGLYTPVYNFDISQKYKDALLAVREEQKTRLKDETAVLVSQVWTVNGNVSEGKKMTRSYARVMLRAFNGESDAIMASVRWNNLQRMIDRLENTFQAVNKLGETQQISIQRDYFQLKLKELHLTYEYQEKLNAEKEEQRRIRDQIREEERAQREFQEEIRRSEEEERRSRIALERAKQELQVAQGAELGKLNSKVQALEAQLAEALANKERAKSQAELTRSGNVYVISNVGSFGENRFKIGMTRRLEPLDRVYELGDASVPFEFDVHAMIPSDNAPQLEAALHAKFRKRSANLVNPRKEFFDVSIDEIIEAVREYDTKVEFLRVPEAKTYRQSLALRAQQPQNGTAPTSVATTDYQVHVLIDGKQEGPFSFPQLNEKIVQGLIDPATALMWYQGMENWTPIKQFQQA